ncbi:hypothetical protein [Kaistia sp. MMO-174]|uniref:hypothetical protein n=1 Tax=Kaistia sp. MMO-174 TaxID=3081256 RepID=UPI00301A3A71
MSVRDPNVAVAVQFWSDPSRSLPINPIVSDLLAQHSPNRTSVAEQLARRAFIEKATTAIQQLIDAHASPEAAIIYASSAFAELLGRLVGTSHDAPCTPCLHANLGFLQKGYLAGFMLQVREQQEARSVA